MDPTRRLTCLCSVIVALSGATGCVPEPKPGFDAVAPNARLDAIVDAADRDDLESLRELVGQLESSDPAARVLAIRALERRTGNTFGYEAGDPVWRRRPAVDRWNTFVDEAAALASDQALETEPVGSDQGG